MAKTREKRQREIALNTYRTAFESIDRSKNGTVDPNEVVKFVASQGMRVDTRRFWRLFNTLDADNSSSMDFDEFVNMMDIMNDPQKAAEILGAADKEEGSVPGFPALDSPGSPLPPSHKLPPGTAAMTDLVGQHRQLADIWSAVVRLRTQKVAQKIDPESLRRFGMGGMTAKQAEEEDKAINLESKEDVIYRFASLFSVHHCAPPSSCPMRACRRLLAESGLACTLLLCTHDRALGAAGETYTYYLRISASPHTAHSRGRGVA